MDSFRELIKKEMSDDNLDFWQAVEAFRKMKRRSGPFLAAAKDIYLSYIKTKKNWVSDCYDKKTYSTNLYSTREDNTYRIISSSPGAGIWYHV